MFKNIDHLSAQSLRQEASRLEKLAVAANAELDYADECSCRQEANRLRALARRKEIEE